MKKVDNVNDRNYSQYNVTNHENTDNSQEQNIKDSADISNSCSETVIEMLSERDLLKAARRRNAVQDQSPDNSIFKTQFNSEQETQILRRRSPIVMAHGTMVDETALFNYKEAASRENYPVDLTTNVTIKDGQRLEESGQHISRRINNTRMEIAENNLQKAQEIKDNPEALREFFLLDDNLHGNPDSSTAKIAELLPGVVDKMQDIMNHDNEELLETFSTRTRMLEEELAEDIKKTGFGSWMKTEQEQEDVSQKAALEIIDCISPRAALVGHSMGGFVMYSIAMNPKESLDDDSKFRYDAGNGVSTVLTLGSPVGKGVNKTLPIGLATLGYDIYDKTTLKPLEGFPGMQYAMMNPFFNSSYRMGKKNLRESVKTSSEISSIYTNPMSHMKSPGYKQITEGSEFIDEYIKDKKIPPGMTAIAATCENDGISEPDRSKLDETQINAHNIDVDVHLEKEDLKKLKATVPTMSHIKMSYYPLEHRDEFREEIFENPDYIPRVLDRTNSEGVRWNCLHALQENVNKNPDYFNTPEMKKPLESVREVAQERIPFKESPSYIAKQILDIVDRDKQELSRD
jgi:hypothetical protein